MEKTRYLFEEISLDILSDLRFFAQIMKSNLTAVLTDFELKVVSIKYKYKAGEKEIFQTHPAPELDKQLLKSTTRKRKAEKNAFSTCDARIHL